MTSVQSALSAAKSGTTVSVGDVVRITTPLIVPSGVTMSDARVEWIGGDTDDFAIRSRGPLRNIDVIARGKCRGVLIDDVRYRMAVDTLSIWKPVGDGVSAVDCWGSDVSRVTIREATGCGVRMHRCNSAQWSDVFFNKCVGSDLLTVGTTDLLSLRNVGFEQCDPLGLRLALFERCIAISISGLRAENNRAAESIIRLIAHRKENRLHSACCEFDGVFIAGGEPAKRLIDTIGGCSSLVIDRLATRYLSQAVVGMDTADETAVAVHGDYGAIPTIHTLGQ